MSSFQGLTHLVAGTEAEIPRVLEALRASGIEPEGHPDIYVRSYASFGVDEARDIIARASSRAVAAVHRTFIVATPNMTTEAQNALLKTLEDAPGGAAFFLIVSSPDMLLPTVRSRAIPFELPGVTTVSTQSVADAAAFLAAAPAARIDMLKGILDADERDLSGALSLLASLERALAPRITEPGVREGLAALYRAREYIGDKGSMMKPLLEQVALLVPVI